MFTFTIASIQQHGRNLQSTLFLDLKLWKTGIFETMYSAINFFSFFKIHEKNLTRITEYYTYFYSIFVQYLLRIGIRRPIPNVFGDTLMVWTSCARLYSAI